MTDTATAERYIRLGLRLGRHVEGLVDAYFGPPELAAEVDAEPLFDPRDLVADADALLADGDDGWLRDQVVGLRTFAGVLAGESRTYADEVEGCYGVRPTHTDESAFAAAHEQLEELLPGDGTLAARHQRWEASIRIPADRVGDVVGAAIEEARRQTRGIVDLPEDERVELEIVHDEAWMAFCEYLGNDRSRISVNTDLPYSALDVLVLAMHETYPGHHTEACVKDHGLVSAQGLLEHAIVMVPTPQSLVAEGIACVAPHLLLHGEGGPALAALVRDAGVDFDLTHALAVKRALEPCQWAEVNAALMLHEQAATDDEVREYVRRWGLVTDQLAGHVIRFLREPTSRTYILTYPAGLELADAYVRSTPDGFRRLLTEQVRVRDLLAARDRAAISSGA